MGKVANLVGYVYPAGKIGEVDRIQLKAKWSRGLGKKGLDQGVVLLIEVKVDDPMTTTEVLKPFVENIEAVAKKKQRIGGRDGWYVRIEVSVERS